MADFNTRLQRCAQKAQLSAADLHHWFDVPYPTIRYWLIGKHSPNVWSLWHVERLLVLLERSIRHKHGFPIPVRSAHARPGYLRKLRHDLDRTKVSRKGFAK